MFHEHVDDTGAWRAGDAVLVNAPATGYRLMRVVIDERNSPGVRLVVCKEGESTKFLIEQRYVVALYRDTFRG